MGTATWQFPFFMPEIYIGMRTLKHLVSGQGFRCAGSTASSAAPAILSGQLANRPYWKQCLRKCASAFCKGGEKGSLCGDKATTQNIPLTSSSPPGFRSKSRPGNAPGSPHARCRACAVTFPGLTKTSRKAGKFPGALWAPRNCFEFPMLVFCVSPMKYDMQ